MKKIRNNNNECQSNFNSQARAVNLEEFPPFLLQRFKKCPKCEAPWKSLPSSYERIPQKTKTHFKVLYQCKVCSKTTCKKMSLSRTNKLAKKKEKMQQHNLPSSSPPLYPIIRLHQEIEEFYQWMKPSELEERIRLRVVDRLTSLILKEWPHAKVELFGSLQTGLYLPTGDIDLVVFGRWRSLPLHTLKNLLLKTNIALPTSIRVLDKASVPIVKMVDAETQIKVDISFNMTGGVQSIGLIKEFIKLHPELPKLVLVIKQFLQQRELNEVFRGGLSSFCLIFMVISFLQLYPRNVGDQPVNLGVLLLEFFDLYGRHFNYENTGIRLKNGTQYFPRETDRDIPLFIEDPIFADHNVGKSSHGILKVRKAFEYAYVLLSREVSVQGYNGESILNKLIQVQQEVINYRDWAHHTFHYLLEDSSCFSR